MRTHEMEQGSTVARKGPVHLDESLDSIICGDSPCQRPCAADVYTLPDSNVSLQTLPIVSLRKDCRIQHRMSCHAHVVEQYTALMLDGVEFPPVRLWYDAKHYWLTDGYQRVAAAERAGFSTIAAEVHYGSFRDAQWDSYSVNATHGLRRTTTEMRRIVEQALRHPAAARLSNVQIGKHIGMPEATVRRWRKRLSSQSDEDGVRLATRGTRTYPIDTRRIGKRATRPRAKSLTDLRMGLDEMRSLASPDARRILNVFGHWAFGQGTTSDCLEALEKIVQGRSEACGAG